MDIATLCREINLQPEVKTRVITCEESFDFKSVDKQLRDFAVYEKMGEASGELKGILGEDQDNIKILTCMLKASVTAYETYRKKGISDEIYFATMKCYSRFIDETYKRTGRYYFDREWWTTRQAGCHLFRIDELEYEIVRKENEITIGIHIPSDADFSPSAVDRSLENARRFFIQYYPETEGAEYCCESWLLDGQLRGMVRENANIVSFQNRFEILDEGTAGTDFIEWVFQRNSADTDYAEFPENTSLQRNLKKHLLAGGVIRSAYGKILANHV